MEVKPEDFEHVMRTIDKLEDSLKCRLIDILKHLDEINNHFREIKSDIELHNMRIERLEKLIEGKQHE